MIGAYQAFIENDFCAIRDQSACASAATAHWPASMLKTASTTALYRLPQLQAELRDKSQENERELLQARIDPNYVALRRQHRLHG